MATTNSTTENGTDSVPASTALLGVDTTGARHYMTNPVHGDVTIYVKAQTGQVQTYDLAETPCDGVGGPDRSGGWFDHVARKRGWDLLAGDILGQQLDALAEGQR